MPEALLSAESIVAGYGGAPILHGVTVQAHERQITAIVGPNGAGKSTLLKSLTGEVVPTSGRVCFRDETVTALSTEKRAARGLGYVPQVENVFPSLSIKENLEMGGYLRRRSIGQNLERVLTLFPDLAQKGVGRHAGTLSGGQRSMLALARALMAEPALLLLDEPTAGLAPKYVDSVWEHVTKVAADGVAILVVEQNTRRALQLCNSAFVLVLGRNGPSGSGQELLADARISDLYIGGAAKSGSLPVQAQVKEEEQC